MTLKASGHCPCSAAAFDVEGPVLARYACHCEICQHAHNAPFADRLIVWATALRLHEKRAIRFRKMRTPTIVWRGACRFCMEPVCDRIRVSSAFSFALIPVRNLPPGVALPALERHVFYHRRVADVVDDTPKVSGFWASEWALLRMLLRRPSDGAAPAPTLSRERERE